MSYVIAAPEMMTSAAADLATIGSNVSAAHAAAAIPTLAVVPAAADEVSASIAHLFSAHAANYQAMAAQAAAFNDQFVQHLTAGAFSYASIEAALASLLQDLNVNAHALVSGLVGFVSLVASMPPQQALIFLLELPFIPLELAVLLIALFYLISTGQFF
jgi:hypothetical protein